MSKKALYRNHVALVNVTSGWVDGEPTSELNQVVWTKGNIQPFKLGLSITDTDAGVRFKDWRTLYLKDMPLAAGSFQSISYFVYNNVWYRIESEQDWSIQARGVKHYKIIGQMTAKPDGITTPVPLGKITQDFENAINELSQATKLI